MDTKEIKKPIISTIIVTYNTKEVTLRCLQKLRDALDDLPSETFVVDNASIDGTVETIRKEFPRVYIIENAFSDIAGEGIPHVT